VVSATYLALPTGHHLSLSCQWPFYPFHLDSTSQCKVSGLYPLYLDSASPRHVSGLFVIFIGLHLSVSGKCPSVPSIWTPISALLSLPFRLLLSVSGQWVCLSLSSGLHLSLPGQWSLSIQILGLSVRSVALLSLPSGLHLSVSGRI
jgi:hypothetical protein